MTPEIKRLTSKDVNKVRKFINDNWKENHILARDRRFFDWMFHDKDDLYNMFISVDDENKVIGIKGFIRYNDQENPDISGSMWKVIKGIVPSLGLELGCREWQEIKPRMSVAAGLSLKCIRIEELNGNYVGELSHYYYLNKCDTYKIAKINDYSKQAVIDEDDEIQSKWMLLENTENIFDMFDEKYYLQKLPYKSKKYFIHRYVQHPYYKYQFYQLVLKGKKEKALLVIRVQEHENSQMIKVIDFLGDENMLSFAKRAFGDLAVERNAEYIDFYNYGVSKEILKKAGFNIVNEDEKNILPSLFSPYLQENHRIMFSSTFLIDNLKIFLGDGDQDRPC